MLKATFRSLVIASMIATPFVSFATPLAPIPPVRKPGSQLTPLAPIPPVRSGTKLTPLAPIPPVKK